MKIFGGNNILVTLQIIETEHKPSEWFEAQISLLFEQLKMLSQTNWKDTVTVYIKSHPRSTGEYDLSRIYQFPFVKPYNEETIEYILHLTFYSTSALDMAQWGIPTLFLYSDTLPEGRKVFIEEFEYPFPDVPSAVDWLSYLEQTENRTVVKEKIARWHSRFYAPFDMSLLTRLLNHHKETVE